MVATKVAEKEYSFGPCTYMYVYMGMPIVVHGHNPIHGTLTLSCLYHHTVWLLFKVHVHVHTSQVVPTCYM